MEYRGLQGTSGRAGGRVRDEDDLRGVGWHVTVNTPTAFSAEQVAEWQATQRSYVNGRPVYSGYNTLIDSDSIVRFWPDDRAPNGARGGDGHGSYNMTLIHLSFACNIDTWARYLNWARDAKIMAARERWRIFDKFDWPLRLLTKEELGRGLKGDITHHRLDPGRRRDPGARADGFGEFDFDEFYGLVQGDEPPPRYTPEESMFGYLKQSDEGEDIVQLKHLLNSFHAATHGMPTGDSRIKDDDLTPGGLIRPTRQFNSTCAAYYQHAIWRLEGWVLGRPIYAGEEGGSRVTVQALTELVKANSDLRAGLADTDPSTDLTQSGVDLKDARAAAEWVRANVKVEL